MRITTNPNLMIHITKENNLYILVSGKPGIEYRENVDFYVEVLFLVQQNLSIEEMIDILKENNWYISESNLENLIYDWLDRNILKYEYDIDDVIERNNWQKYDRQIKNFGCLPQISNLDGINFQEKLKISKVAIIGVGGVGSYIAHSLASIGIGEIRIVDGDVVEISNTSRQILYLESDVGYKKVDIAKTRLHKVNPLMNIKVLSRFLDEHSKGEIVDFLRGVDFIVHCADTPRGEIEYIVDSVSNELKTPWITFAPYNFHKIFLGPILIPGKTKSLSELIPKKDKISPIEKKISKINEQFTPTIMDPYNGLAAKMAMVEIVKFLTGYEESFVINKRILLDTKNWGVEIYEFEND